MKSISIKNLALLAMIFAAFGLQNQVKAGDKALAGQLITDYATLASEKVKAEKGDNADLSKKVSNFINLLQKGINSADTKISKMSNSMLSDITKLPIFAARKDLVDALVGQPNYPGNLAFIYNINGDTTGSNVTLLIEAARDGNYNAIAPLLKYGANVNAKDSNGFTALTGYAIPGLTGVFSSTPLSVLQKANYERTISALKAAGAK